MKIFDVILNGHSADDNEAMDWARGFVWCECETRERERAYPHSRYIGTDNGIDVYYCYGADHYWFAEEQA